MTETLRRSAFGALVLFLGLAPTGCASAPSPSPASPAAAPARPAGARGDEEGDQTGAASPVRRARAELRKAGETPYQSLYHPLPSQTVLINNATVLTAAGERIERGSVLIATARSPPSAPPSQRPGRRHGRSTAPASG